MGFHWRLFRHLDRRVFDLQKIMTDRKKPGVAFWSTASMF